MKKREPNLRKINDKNNNADKKRRETLFMDSSLPSLILNSARSS
jgi:hypothetical protein